MYIMFRGEFCHVYLDDFTKTSTLNTTDVGRKVLIGYSAKYLAIRVNSTQEFKVLAFFEN